MPSFLKRLKQVLTLTCIIFTVLFVSVFTFGIAVEVKGWAFGLGQTYLVLLFSFLLALSNRLLESRLPRALAVLLHFVATGLSYYFLFILWLGNDESAGVVGLLLLVFAVLYALWLGIYLLFHRKKREARENKEAYQSQFKK